MPVVNMHEAKTHLAELVRRGEVSPGELLDEALARFRLAPEADEADGSPR